MAKYYGAIGCGVTRETAPDVYEEEIEERTYFGDVLRNTSRLQGGQNLNDNLVLDHQISILADPFALSNYSSFRYITLNGVKWKITSVEIIYPRLLLTTGGVYSETTSTETS